MKSYIKTYFKIISWRIFVICIANAMIMTSLFPFDNLSMNYISSPPVLKVMLKTFVIAGLLLTIVNVVAFHVFRLQLWETNVLHASFYHIFFGVIVPFICGLGLIKLFYGSDIFEHDHVNSDLMLMLLLLGICNLLMVLRMYAFYFNEKNSNITALNDENSTLNAHHKLEKEALKSKHEEEINGLKIAIDSLTKELQINQINTDKFVLEAELRERKWKDKVDGLIREIGTKSTGMTYEFDEKYVQQLSYFVRRDSVSEVYDPLKNYQFVSEMKDEMVIKEEHVAFIYGANREGILCQDIHLLDGEVFTVYGSSLEEMNRIFPSMVRISRNHLIPGSSVISYEVMSSKLVKVRIFGQQQPIEMKHEFIKKVFAWIVLQYVWNQYREKQSSPAVSV